MRAIEDGADFQVYAAHDQEMKAEAEAVEQSVAALEAQQAARDRPPPDFPAIFGAALASLEALLGDADLVAQANEENATPKRSITFIPDPASEDGQAAEIQMGLGSLCSRAGLSARKTPP